MTTSEQLTPATDQPAARDGRLTFPISPGYVQSWTPVRALCELIANALDEDPDATAVWADGVLTISDDGPGIPEEGMVLGYSSKTDDQIGQFGEGKKLAFLVLDRSPQIGAVHCETVGYRFTPTVERERLLGGMLPSRSGNGAEMLVYHVSANQRRRGTVITVACPKDLADEAVGRFRALTEPGYMRPETPGAVVLTGTPGRVWIGGVLVTTVPGFLASYDLPLTSKALQNRDRTVIEADALRDAVRAILAVSQDPGVIGRFATHVLADHRLREPEQFFPDVREPRTQAAWRSWAVTYLPEKTFYTDSGTEEAALELKDKGFTELTSRGLARHQQYTFMRLLGVTLAPVRHREYRKQTSKHMKHIHERSLTAPERAALTDGVTLIRRAIGSFALDRVTVYTTSEQTDCPDGLYMPATGDVAVNREILDDVFRLRAVLAHEAAHRVTHRGGGRWLPSPDYRDRCRGFENTLGDFTAHLLRYVADGEPLPPAADRHATSATRLAAADDPVVAVSRRELAHLLLDRLPHALASGGFTTDRRLIASTAVPFEYWRTLTRPKPAGFRRYSSGGQATNYERVALIAEALGVHPPVVWLGYNLCEGSIHSRKREKWGRPGHWSALMRTNVQRACTELLALGGDYATHVPALHALADGTTPAPIGDESWQAPARALITLERRRLGLDPATQPAEDHRE